MAKKDYSKLEKDDLLKVIEKLESRKKYGLIWDDEIRASSSSFLCANCLPEIHKEVIDDRVYHTCFFVKSK